MHLSTLKKKTLSNAWYGCRKEWLKTMQNSRRLRMNSKRRLSSKKSQFRRKMLRSNTYLIAIRRKKLRATKSKNRKKWPLSTTQATMPLLTSSSIIRSIIPCFLLMRCRASRESKKRLPFMATCLKARTVIRKACRTAPFLTLRHQALKSATTGASRKRRRCLCQLTDLFHL